MLYTVHKLYILLPVLIRYFGHLHGWCQTCYVSIILYAWKVSKAFPFTANGYEMASKIVTGGIFTSPLALQRLTDFNWLLARDFVLGYFSCFSLFIVYNYFLAAVSYLYLVMHSVWSIQLVKESTYNSYLSYNLYVIWQWWSQCK